ncbi:MAG: restriction endonuclease, SacI family [Candidatus Coatesbacteria bacterium]|nr:restriction endonuclease, SacI family [Candidatus Coatesbacteria bacterium]
MPSLDYERAASLLEELFSEAEKNSQNGEVPQASAEIASAADLLFSSRIKSYREVLIGCGLARLLDPSINIRLPYISQGEEAFNGRTLDERVINPFLQRRFVPCSRGPYLAIFRRSVRFVPETAVGLRDKDGYSALLVFIDALESSDESTARSIVAYIIYCFVLLRDEARIPVSRISRMSLEQWRVLIGGLLSSQSGGLLPVLLAVAMLRTIKIFYKLRWEISWQGINVSDTASGMAGDITVKQNGNIILAIEVTGRRIEKARIISTFNTKILRSGVVDYLFVFSMTPPTDDAVQAASAYFSQGHELNFLEIRDWIINNLGTTGSVGRKIFKDELLALLDTSEVPASVKMVWNDIVNEAISF